MKSCVIICDGTADEPAGESPGLTPPDAASTPAMDHPAATGSLKDLNTLYRLYGEI